VGPDLKFVVEARCKSSLWAALHWIESLKSPQNTSVLSAQAWVTMLN